MRTPKAVLIVGPTGSGKTPLGQRLGERGLCGFDCLHLDFGELLRSYAEGIEPVMGLSEEDRSQIREILSSNALLTDEQQYIGTALLDHVLRDRAERLIVLNGFPRHEGQIEVLAERVDLGLVVELVCAPSDARARIAGNTGGDRITRVDDSDDEITRKLALYNERTRPMLGRLSEQGATLVRIRSDANTAAEQVQRELENHNGVRTWLSL